MRVAYCIAVFLTLSSFPAHCQAQTPNTGGNPATQTNSDSRSAADTCSEADKGEPELFAVRFPWYVRAVHNKVSENWGTEQYSDREIERCAVAG